MKNLYNKNNQLNEVYEFITDYIEKQLDDITESTQQFVKEQNASIDAIREMLQKFSHTLQIEEEENEEENEEFVNTDVPFQRSITNIQTFLDEHGITIRDDQQDYDPATEHVAILMGKHFQTFHLILEAIKSCINCGRIFGCGIKTFGQSISTILQICTELQTLGFINYSYQGSPYCCLHGEVTDAGVNFINGQWLEQYVHATLKKIVTDQQLTGVEYLNNIKVNLPDDSDFEIDYMLSYNGQTLWIESKSGRNYNEALKKYQTLAKTLKIKNLTVVCANHHELSEFNQLYANDGFKLCGIDALNSALIDFLNWAEA